MNQVIVENNSLKFHAPLFVTMGVLLVSVINLLLDYINFPSKESHGERKDLLLPLRANVSFSLFFPVAVLYTARAYIPSRCVGLYYTAFALSSSIRCYHTLKIIKESETKIFSNTWATVLYLIYTIFIILFPSENRGPYWLRVSLLAAFGVIYTGHIARYYWSVNIRNELSVTTCTRESIVLSVTIGFIPWILMICYYFITDASDYNGKGLHGQTAEQTLNTLVCFNSFVIVQSVALIICPERAAKLLLFRMKGHVLQTANKLKHAIQPSLLLLKRTVTMLKHPQIMQATHTRDTFKESYENLAIACERILKDIDDIKKDELLVMPRTGGFRPRLSAVSEDSELGNPPMDSNIINVANESTNDTSYCRHMNLRGAILDDYYDDRIESRSNATDEMDCMSGVRRGSDFSLISSVSDVDENEDIFEPKSNLNRLSEDIENGIDVVSMHPASPTSGGNIIMAHTNQKGNSDVNGRFGDNRVHPLTYDE